MIVRVAVHTSAHIEINFQKLFNYTKHENVKQHYYFIRYCDGIWLIRVRVMCYTIFVVYLNNHIIMDNVDDFQTCNITMLYSNYTKPQCIRLILKELQMLNFRVFFSLPVHLILHDSLFQKSIYAYNPCREPFLTNKTLQSRKVTNYEIAFGKTSTSQKLLLYCYLN